MAAYAHNFVVSIVGPNGSPFVEKNRSGDRTIHLPFETEYKIRLKNKNNNVRAKVSVLIDGMDISPGRMFILGPNQDLDLERFLQDGDLNKGNKFKFVNREKGAATGEIQDPYSHQLGRVEVRFHKEVLVQSLYPIITTTFPCPPYYYGSTCGGVGGLIANSGSNLGLKGPPTAAYNSHTAQTNTFEGLADVTNCTAPVSETKVSDVGGTAMGTESGQQFQDTYADFLTELSPITIAIQLRGLKIEPKPVVVEVQHAQAVIERGLAPFATNDERDLARAYLAVLAHQSKK